MKVGYILKVIQKLLASGLVLMMLFVTAACSGNALPEGMDRERLLAALQDAGVLKNGQISLGEGKNRP